MICVYVCVRLARYPERFTELVKALCTEYSPEEPVKARQLSVREIFIWYRAMRSQITMMWKFILCFCCGDLIHTACTGACPLVQTWRFYSLLSRCVLLQMYIYGKLMLLFVAQNIYVCMFRQCSTTARVLGVCCGAACSRFRGRLEHHHWIASQRIPRRNEPYRMGSIGPRGAKPKATGTRKQSDECT